MIESLLTIGIATKNRHEELNVTLRHLRNGPFRECSIVVIDDGSEPAIEVPEDVGRVRLVRHEVSKDVAYSRNELGQLIETPFWMTLDDDSYPIEVDMEGLVKLLQSSDDVIAVSLPFKELYGDEWVWLNPSTQNKAYPVRTFVACSGIINLKRFREIGVYSDWVYQFGEESDLSLRALKKGYRTIHSDMVRVQHNKVNVARSMARIDYFGARNQVLMAMYYLPLSILPLRLAKLILHHFRMLFRHGRVSGIWGLLCGLSKGLANIFRRRMNPLSRGEFKSFRCLPGS